MQASTEKFLSRQEVADLLGVAVQTLALWAHKKSGPPFLKIGRYARYRHSDLDAWIAAQQRGGSDAA